MLYILKQLKNFACSKCPMCGNSNIYMDKYYYMHCKNCGHSWYS